MKYSERMTNRIEDHFCGEAFNANSIQTTKGALSSRRLSCCLPQVTVDFTSVSTSTISSGEAVDGYIIVIPSDDSLLIANGNRITKESFWISPPNEAVLLCQSAYYKSNSIHITTEKAQQAFSINTLNKLNLFMERHVMESLPPAVVNHFKRKLRIIIQSLLTKRYPVSSSASIEQQIFSHIESVVGSLGGKYQQKMTERSRNTRFRVVTRALNYIQQSGNHTLAVNELADRCYCSRRTLEYAFLSVLNVTPKHYIKLQFLNQVRLFIQRCKPTQLNHVCMQFDIKNPTRFSNDYKQLFTEYPIETIKFSENKVN